VKTGFNGLKDGQDDFCWCGGLMGWIDWVVFKSVNPLFIKTGFNGLKDGQEDFCWCGGLMGWIDWVVFKSVKKAVVKITYYL
jgi:hypothetical protein